ncbi:MAG: hypothetical protein K8E66_13945, partial [Phycisphaerales bacterium]|nr:hypothetical protein [Phycisphaerales bacterium]
DTAQLESATADLRDVVVTSNGETVMLTATVTLDRYTVGFMPKMIETRIDATLTIHAIASIGAGCNAADLAEPFGLLDLADITAFVAAFVNNEPPADLAPPAGTFDLADITAFVSAFTAGCP